MKARTLKREAKRVGRMSRGSCQRAVVAVVAVGVVVKDMFVLIDTAEGSKVRCC